MSLTDLVKGIEGSLPPNVHKVMMEIAQEVENHKSLLAEVGSLGGPTGEAATAFGETLLGDMLSGKAGEAAKAEDAPSESPQAVIPAPSETSTGGESPVDKQEAPKEEVKNLAPVESEPHPTEGTKDTPSVGNQEQSLPYEQWPKDDAA